MTGRAARANALRQVVRGTDGPPVWWYRCLACGLEFPSRLDPSEPVTHFDICQTCLVADLSALARSHPGLTRMLPTVRAVQGLRPVSPTDGGGVSAALRAQEDL